MFWNIRSFVNRRIKAVKVSFFILEISFRHSWLLTWWWKVHLHAANVLLLRRMPVAIRWHLKVSTCGWLADLHGNTGSPDAAPGPTASAALPLPAVPSATSLILTDHLLWRSSIRLYLFYGLSLRPMPIDCCIDSKRCADVWESVYFFSNWIGKAADFGWVCTWETVCLLIEWMSWSVMEMKLKQTGGLLVSRTSRAGSAARCCR